ncbi:MAG: laccase domain-containing protein, partial [candidate division WOR-3 bacterium]
YFTASPQPGLTLAFTTRRGGVSTAPYASLNSSIQVGDAENNVRENLRRIQGALHLPVLVTVRQNHSDTVVEVKDAEMMPESIDADALFSRQTGIA